MPAALIAIGKPWSSTNVTTSSTPPTGSAVPTTSGAPARWAMWRALTLSPSASIAAGGGPIQVRPVSITACVQWADVEGYRFSREDVRGELPRGVLGVEVSRAGLTQQRISLVGQANMRSVAIGVGIHGDAGDAGVPAGAGHTHGDLAPIGDEHLRDGRHVRTPWSAAAEPSRTRSSRHRRSRSASSASVRSMSERRCSNSERRTVIWSSR